LRLQQTPEKTDKVILSSYVLRNFVTDDVISFGDEETDYNDGDSFLDKTVLQKQ
jgi:hypothetical protein